MSEEKNEEVEILDEYDFSNAVIGKYAKQYAEGTNIVVLEPDVAKVFPDSAAVNQALQQLVCEGKWTCKKRKDLKTALF